MTLSKDRALSVALHLATLEAKSARFSIAGYGEAQPILTNDTSEDRQKSRRVDIAVLANDKLKKAALLSFTSTPVDVFPRDRLHFYSEFPDHPR